MSRNIQSLIFVKEQSDSENRLQFFLITQSSWQFYVLTSNRSDITNPFHLLKDQNVAKQKGSQPILSYH